MPRNLWKRVAALLAGTLAMAMAAPSAVHAQTDPDKVFYVVCYVFTPGGDGTAIATTPYRTTWGGWFNGYWERKLYDRILPGTGYRTGRCNPVESAEAAETYYRKSGYNFLKRVDWPKDLFAAAKPAEVAKAGPPVPPKPTPKPAQTASLTVKTDTSIKDAAKAWDEQVKKTLAAEAQKKVETAARQAQADAKLKADYEAFFAERRKQGRAQ